MSDNFIFTTLQVLQEMEELQERSWQRELDQQRKFHGFFVKTDSGKYLGKLFGKTELTDRGGESTDYPTKEAAEQAAKAAVASGIITGKYSIVSVGDDFKNTYDDRFDESVHREAMPKLKKVAEPTGGRTVKPEGRKKLKNPSVPSAAKTVKQEARPKLKKVSEPKGGGKTRSTGKGDSMPKLKKVKEPTGGGKTQSGKRGDVMPKLKKVKE